MRVLVVNDYAREYGGAETYVFSLISLLRDRGHTVLFIGDKPRLIHYVSRIANPWYLLKFFFLILFWRPDVIHINKYNLVYSFMPALAGKLLGKRVVITMHDVGLFCPDGLGLLANGKPCERHFHGGCFNSRCFRTTSPGLDLQRRLNFLRNAIQIPMHKRTVNCFLCPSTHMVDWVRRAYGDKAAYLSNFLAAPETDPDPPPSLRGRPLRLFFAGRLVREKGLQIAIRALPGLDAVLTLAGEGAYRPVLEKLAGELGVAEKVVFLGKIPNQEVAANMRTCDVGILPSLWLENNPLFAFEAMKCSRALVGADVGGIPDLIENDGNGYLFRLGDAEDLKRILQRVIDEDSAIRLGRGGLAKLRRDLGPQKHAERIESFYRG